MTKKMNKDESKKVNFTGNDLDPEERSVLALERVTDSMEALVSTTLSKK